MTKLEIDLFCNIRRDKVAYRLYVNDELMTERDYIWDNTKQYLTEIVPLDIDPGTHTIHIENLNPDNGEFSINTIRLNGKIITLYNGKEFRYEDQRLT